MQRPSRKRLLSNRAKKNLVCEVQVSIPSDWTSWHRRTVLKFGNDKLEIDSHSYCEVILAKNSLENSMYLSNLNTYVRGGSFIGRV